MKSFNKPLLKLAALRRSYYHVIPIIQMLLKKFDDYLTKPRERDAIRLAFSTYLYSRYEHQFFKPVTEESINMK